VSAIRSIVFDIGRVFVRLDPRPLMEFLAQHESVSEDLAGLIARIDLAEHECGRLSGAALIERMGALTARPVTAEQLHAKWVDMFELEPAMVELARRLRPRYGVYLLSNIGELHWNHLCRHYGLDRLGHGALPSFVAGHMKPHAPIYAEAERRFALEPASTVFIDDRPENIAAARARGWRGIVHERYDRTLAELRALGVSA
jgi:HAD superfamily hydrolase (TIGR01509 family)